MTLRFWTPERCRQLTRLWYAPRGIDVSDIARMMGRAEGDIRVQAVGVLRLGPRGPDAPWWRAEYFGSVDDRRADFGIRTRKAGRLMLPWVKGPARGNDPVERGEVECGDRFLVLVHCVETVRPRLRMSLDPGGEKHLGKGYINEFWDAQVIIATEDGWDDSDGETWGAWDWSSVEYFIKLDKAMLPNLKETA